MATENDLRNLRKAAARAGRLERQLEAALEENYLLRRCGIRVGESIVGVAELVERAEAARAARATAAKAQKARELVVGERFVAPPREKTVFTRRRSL